MEKLTGSYSTKDWAQLTKDWDITLYIISPTTGELLDMPSVTLIDSDFNGGGWRITEEETLLESTFMDADRQKLELDTTKEFEFADAEATRLID
jgi:hypothetical protein